MINIKEQLFSMSPVPKWTGLEYDRILLASLVPSPTRESVHYMPPSSKALQHSNFLSVCGLFPKPRHYPQIATPLLLYKYTEEMQKL